ncbi:DNA-directed RNA polymerase subunit beta [Paenibacillus sp. GCM10023252]|uniref:DNA-directed RNA polymerase subunit beta n=1 Tax=Paenibacillus sp. GCM10023252 TaxID=3252649 RepID=UPI00361D48F3
MSTADERAASLSRSTRNQEESARESDQRGDSREHADKTQSRGSRTLLWMLKKGIVPIIGFIILMVGLYIGYSVIGKQEGSEVFRISTWKHMWDLIFADS